MKKFPQNNQKIKWLKYKKFSHQKSKNQINQNWHLPEHRTGTCVLKTNLVGVLLLEILLINWPESCWNTLEVNMFLLLRPIRNLPAISTMLQLSHWRLFRPIGGLPAIVSQWESRWSPIGQNFKKYVNFLSIYPSLRPVDTWSFKKQDPYIFVSPF